MTRLRLRLRLALLGYALSCAFNVSCLRRPEDTSAGESTSGRVYWEAYHGSQAGHWTWLWAERAIDAIFFLHDRHCMDADLRDYERAQQKMRRYEERAHGEARSLQQHPRQAEAY